jgi:hypothetical protein
VDKCKPLVAALVFGLKQDDDAVSLSRAVSAAGVAAAAAAEAGLAIYCWPRPMGYAVS